MSEKKSSGPSFLISKEEKRLQESIRQSEAAPSANPEAGTRGTKDNSESASLRLGNLPQAEQVREVDREKNAGAAIRQAQSQNESDGKGKAATNQIPVSRSRPTTTSSNN